MSYLNLDESLERSSLGIDHSASIDDPGIAESREIQEIDPDRPALTEIPGRVLLVEPAVGERWWLRNELLAGRMEVFEATDLITAQRGRDVPAEPDPGSTAAAHLQRAGAGPPTEAG